MEPRTDMAGKQFFIETFGCQMNENDSGRIIGALGRMGCKPTDTPDDADIIILNTCSVRDKAEHKVYSALGRLRELKAARPGLIIGVGGCVAQQEGEKLLKRLPHLDLVFGTHNIHRLPDLLRDIESGNGRLKAVEFTDEIEEESFEYLIGSVAQEEEVRRVKAFVTVMRGCDNFCTYCIVPYVRGRELSRKSGSILREVERLAEGGIKEVMLVGQNVNSYGNEGKDISFPDLLRVVCKIEGIKRVRFVTSHPKDMSDELIRLFGEEEKLCRQIHLPVQSGSNKVLGRMKRGYTREDYLGKYHRLKGFYPDMAFTTDVIVGFPGETDADFADTMSLIKEAEFDNIFSFKYSIRPETAAASLKDHVPVRVKDERLRLLQEFQRDMTVRMNRNMVGKKTEILVEGRSRAAELVDGNDDAKGNQLTGRTPCNKVVNIIDHQFKAKEVIGSILPVTISGAGVYSLTGRLV